VPHASVAELADALGLGPSPSRGEGSSPSARTHRDSLIRRRIPPPVAGGRELGVGGVNRLTSSAYAPASGVRGIDSSTGDPSFIDKGTTRELGIATSMFRPTVDAMSSEVTS